MEFRICASGKYLLFFNSKLCNAIFLANQSVYNTIKLKKQIKVYSFNPDMSPKSHTEYHENSFSHPGIT